MSTTLCMTLSRVFFLDSFMGWILSHPTYPPPPLVVPHPLSFPGGGGGAGGPSLGRPKIFRYGSLCCCVGDCVVGYCHLYPLYSWEDILLTFAEWNLTAQPCFSLGQM